MKNYFISLLNETKDPIEKEGLLQMFRMLIALRQQNKIRRLSTGG